MAELPPSAGSWTAWSAWAKANALAKPRRAPESELEFELRVPGGRARVAVGQPSILWNGIVVDLGFAPRLIDGEVFINALDLEKVFEPALLGPLNFHRNHSRVVVIDPGHGGENSGAKSVVNGHFEKEYTLDWARRMAPLLAAEGWRVFLTRTNDVDLSLTERVNRADLRHADLFISLHFNSSGGANGLLVRPHNGERGGVETYCLTPAGMPSNLTREFDDDPRQLYPNNAFDAENLRCALRIQETLVQSTGARDRGVRHARFMTVLREQNRPAVLIEGGFLSEPQEARLISAVGYRQLLAEAVARALAPLE